MANVCYVQLLYLVALTVSTEGFAVVGELPTSHDDSLLSSLLPSNDNAVLWKEVIIPPPISMQDRGVKQVSDTDLAVGSNVGERIQYRESVLLLENLVDSETCRQLVQLAQESQIDKDNNVQPALLRIPTIAAACGCLADILRIIISVDRYVRIDDRTTHFYYLLTLQYSVFTLLAQQINCAL